MLAESPTWAAAEDVGFGHARNWSSLERLTIRGWSSESDAGYLITFIRGLLGWHGRRTIDQVELEVLYRDTAFQVTDLQDEFNKMKVQLKIIYTCESKGNFD
jgi:hypothetical protein